MGNPGIFLASGIDGPRKRLKKPLNDVVGFVAIKQFQMQIAAGFIRKSLKKFFGQSKSKSR